MDEISDEQKLEWLTTLVSPTRRAMINSVEFEESWHAPEYRVTPLRRQIHQTSLGHLDKLPPELLTMVLAQMTCGDLEALHSCSTSSRLAVLAFPLYHNLLQHAPTILAILKQTRLARSFTMAQIYETFTSSLCTTCGQFGGYVFLPSFTRCCIDCAETELKFLPITRDGAKTEFGIKEKKIFDGLPQLNTIEGCYSTVNEQVKYYTHRLKLYSREMIETFRSPKHKPRLSQHSQRYVGANSIKAHQRYMALAPLPCFVPRSASMERGVYCAGCDIRAREHLIVRERDGVFYTHGYIPQGPPLTDGVTIHCWPNDRSHHCLLTAGRDRLHDSRHILSHLQGCEAAQALLKAKWTRSQKNVSAIDS